MWYIYRHCGRKSGQHHLSTTTRFETTTRYHGRSITIHRIPKYHTTVVQAHSRLLASPKGGQYAVRRISLPDACVGKMRHETVKSVKTRFVTLITPQRNILRVNIAHASVSEPDKVGNADI